MKKSVIIVGGGVSGMSAGVYLCRNGYDVTIYEKHIAAGGECTGWTRKGIYIDGCAHWIVGTKDGSDVNLLWKEVGAIKTDTVIHDNEYFAKYVVGEETVTFYSDLDKMKAEFLRVA
ncbi:MAG: NAD(P)/FAD-dependent oxidoreductase, partial [Bacilli bacterium]|nr:NAD(P)/FAD-dependent oxidoreductase [Bacilli bacterium]